MKKTIFAVLFSDINCKVKRNKKEKTYFCGTVAQLSVKTQNTKIEIVSPSF